MTNKKYAFFTIDAESFLDTECIYNLSKKEEVIVDDMLDGLDEYLNLLDEFNIKATMFFVCSTARKIPQKVRQYIDRGHKIALHGLDHTAPLDMDNDTFYNNVKQAKQELEENFGQRVVGFRAPFFSIDNDKLKILKDLGFLYDASCSLCNYARHCGTLDLTSFDSIIDNVYKKDNFYEFGVNTTKLFGKPFSISGGGWARIMPSWYFNPTLKNVLKHTNYYMFYLHPFELTKQKIPYFKHLKGYDKMYIKYNIPKYINRIKKVILNLQKQGFTFSCLEDFIEQN